MSQPTLEAGRSIGPYDIDAVLGQGTCGVTYIVKIEINKPALVLKEYLPSALATRAKDGSLVPISGSEDDFNLGLQRFLRDARALLSVRHASLVAVTDVIEANATAYMVMERVQGERLVDVVKRGVTFTGEQLLRLALGLLDATSTLHAAGLIHRDIKENNILLRQDGTPILLDFGGARVGLLRRRLALGQSNSGFEDENSLDGSAGPWTDVHALAALLFRLTRPQSRKPETSSESCPVDVLNALRMGIAAQPGNVDILVEEWRQELQGLLQRLYPHAMQNDSPVVQAVASVPQAEIPVESASATVVSDESHHDSHAPAQAETAPEATAVVTVTAAEATAERTRSGKTGSRKQRKKAKQREKQARKTSRKAPEDTTPQPINATEPPVELPASVAAEPLPQNEIAAASSPVTNVVDIAAGAANEAGSDSTALPATEDADGDMVLDLTTGTYEPMTQSAALPKRRIFASRRVLAVAAALGALLLMSLVFVFRGGSEQPVMSSVPAPAPTESLPPPVVAVPAPAPNATLPAAPVTAETAKPSEPSPAPAATGDTLPVAAQSEAPSTESSPAATSTTMATTSTEDPVQAQVTELLAKAKEDIDALRLSSPEGANALEKLKQVLVLQPNNSEATRGITSISNKYIDLADGAMSRQQLSVAKRYLDLAQSVDPNNPATKDARARLDRLEKDAKESQPDANIVAEHDAEPANRADDLLPSQPETPPATSTSRAEEIRRRLGGNSN